jgi:hypothetical protein
VAVTKEPTLFILITLSLKTAGQTTLETFHTTFGKEQSSAMDLAVVSFKIFLELYYPEHQYLRAENKVFLQDYQRLFPILIPIGSTLKA